MINAYPQIGLMHARCRSLKSAPHGPTKSSRRDKRTSLTKEGVETCAD
jgi:hypothetical protein